MLLLIDIQKSVIFHKQYLFHGRLLFVQYTTLMS